MEVPFQIDAGFSLLTIFLYASLLYGLHFGLTRLDISNKKRIRIVWSAGFFLMAWLGATGAAAINRFFMDFNSLPPKIGIAVLLPLIFAILLAFNSNVKKIVTAIPGSWIVGLQSFRIVMEIILWLLFINYALPEVMTFHGRNFDILAGLSAPFIACYCFRQGDEKPMLLAVWNITGLILLLNVLIHGLLSAPTMFQLFNTDPPNTIIARFPYIWLPTFVVTTAFFLHLITFQKIDELRKSVKKANSR